jgi:hypothetical protein
MRRRKNVLLLVSTVSLMILTVSLIFLVVIKLFFSESYGQLYLCKDCSDDAYRRIATRCYGVREIFLRSGENISFLAYDDVFFNSSCSLKTGANWLIWMNITSDNLVKVVIGSKVFEGRNITYGCINMNNVSITASQDTRIMIEVRSLTSCVFSTRYADLHRIFQALPNLYADRECP